MNYFPNKMKVEFARDAVLCITPIRFHVVQGVQDGGYASRDTRYTQGKMVIKWNYYNKTK